MKRGYYEGGVKVMIEGVPMRLPWKPSKHQLELRREKEGPRFGVALRGRHRNQAAAIEYAKFLALRQGHEIGRYAHGVCLMRWVEELKQSIPHAVQFGNLRVEIPNWNPAEYAARHAAPAAIEEPIEFKEAA